MTDKPQKYVPKTFEEAMDEIKRLRYKHKDYRRSLTMIAVLLAVLAMFMGYQIGYSSGYGEAVLAMKSLVVALP